MTNEELLLNYKVLQKDLKIVIIFLPSDHYINPEKRFAKDIATVLNKEKKL